MSWQVVVLTALYVLVGAALVVAAYAVPGIDQTGRLAIATAGGGLIGKEIMSSARDRKKLRSQDEAAS